MTKRIHLFFTLALSFCIFYAVSRQTQKSFAELDKEYVAANAAYVKALKSGKNITEEEEERLNRTALEKFKTLIANFPSTPGPLDSLRFFSFLKTGELYHYFDELPEALYCYQAAIRIKSRLPALADSFLFKPYLFSGNIFFNKSNLDSASYCFRKAQDILANYQKPLAESERLYNAFGLLYYQSGNYRQAKNYFRKAGEVLPENHPYFKNLFVNYNINFASSLVKLQQYDTALAIYQKLLPYKEHSKEIVNNIGLIYFYSGRPGKAIEQYKQLAYNNAFDIGLYNDRARAWLALGKLDSAESNIDMAFREDVRYNSMQANWDHGLSLKIYGDLQRARGKYDEAIKLYHRAIHQFYPAFISNDIKSNPVKFTGAFSYINLFETLVAKAESFHELYNLKHEAALLEQELAAYQSAFKLISYIERTYDSDEARLFLGKIKYHVHEKPIDAAYQLYQLTKNQKYLELAYEFDQMNKGSILAFNEQQNKLSNPSSSIRQKEKNIKESITRLSIQASETRDPALLQMISNKLSEFEIQLGRIQDEISKTYLVIGTTVPSVAEIQSKLLDESTQLISFHLTATKLTIFSITRSEFQCEQKNLPADFYKVLNSFILNLHSGETDRRSDSASNFLYNFLLGSTIGGKHDRLIIIPDDELNFLPFEALKTNGKYLIQDHSIQYQYSTLLLKKEQLNLSNATTLAMAPFTEKGFSEGNLQFNRLVNSGDEVSGFKGIRYVGEEANKRKFTENIERYDIIHLATHAASTDSSELSYIAFAPWGKNQKDDYLLYAPEIYNLSVKKNKLVILSACETGKGSLVRGEGVMSLSRAFAYAGCPDIITSFWKADDASTSFITEKLHSYLQKGYSIDKALQEAKKDYLARTDINPRMKAPAYWAHLVFIGNYTAGKNSSNLAWIIGAGVAACIGIVLLSLRMHRKKHPSPSTSTT